MISFKLYHLFIGPVSRYSHVGVRVSTYTFRVGGHKHSVHKGLVTQSLVLGPVAASITWLFVRNAGPQALLQTS